MLGIHRPSEVLAHMLSTLFLIFAYMVTHTSGTFYGLQDRRPHLEPPQELINNISRGLDKGRLVYSWLSSLRLPVRPSTDL